MQTLSGACHCGNLQLELTLTRAAGEYGPRACDCDFCTKHSAAWLSDPQGSLAIRIRDEGRVSRYRQGNELAEFLLCSHCGTLAAVLYEDGAGRRFAAVNARTVDGGRGFGPAQPVSPKTLSGEQKTRRWQEVWFPQVYVDGYGGRDA